MASRFRPPRDVPDIGQGPGEQDAFKAWLRTAFIEISEDLAAASATDAPTIAHQERVDVPAGSQRRVQPPLRGMVAIVPCPSVENSGLVCRIMIESPAGALTVVAAPGRGEDGQIFQPTINGAPRATYTLPGVVSLYSNGVSDWKTVAEVPAETVGTEEQQALLAALEATFHLASAHPSLPNARVATSSPDIDVDNDTPGAVSWKLGLAARARGQMPAPAGERGPRGLMGESGKAGGTGPMGPPGITIIEERTLLMPAPAVIAQPRPPSPAFVMPGPLIIASRAAPPQAPPLNPIQRDYMLAYRDDPDSGLNGLPRATGIPNLHPNWVWTRHTFEGAVNNLGAVAGFTAQGDMTFSQRTTSPSRALLGLRCSVPLGGSGYAHLGNTATALTFDDPETLRGFRALLELQTVSAGDDYDFMIGFGDDISDMTGTSLQFGTNSLFFRTQGDGAGGFSWGFNRQSAGVASNPTGPVGVVGDIVLLEAYRTSGTTWQFYVNGVAFTAGSANVPTTGLNFGFGIDDDGGGAVPFIVDIYAIDIFTDELAQRFS